MIDPSPFLSSLAPEKRAKLLSTGTRKHFSVGQLIYGRGEPGTSLFVIETGRVEVSVSGPDGRAAVLNHMGPGEVLGEIALIDEGPRSADAVAATDVTGVLLDKSQFKFFLRDDPAAAYGMISELCSKVRNASDMFETQSRLQGSVRLARCLVRMADKWGKDTEGGLEIGADVTQTDLGDFAGLSRESVNRIFRGWIAQNYVAINAETKALQILDLGTLGRLAEQKED